LGLSPTTAKNVTLAGVKSVTLYDPEPVQISDLGSQFFLREADVGKPRDQTTLGRLKELNSYVPISVLEGDYLSRLGEFQVSSYSISTGLGRTRTSISGKGV
jgi:ubiquitin-activating enzyme E1